MIKRNNKRGFTIVELVIVIAVIAILAAVLIPTFSGIINKANQSADMQAVRQMNTALAIDGAVAPTGIFGLFDVLDELGMTAEDYHPLAKDTYFFWDAKVNRILYVDKDMTVIYPEEYKGKTYDNTCTWLSLTMSIPTEAPDGYSSGDNAVTVKNGAEFVYVLDDINSGNASKTLAITVPADGIDVMGATLSVSAFAKNANYNITVSGPANEKATIKNATAVDAGYIGDGVTDGWDGQYGCSIFGYVFIGNSLKIENVIFENINIKNTSASGAAILVGGNDGTVEISNVIIKDSAVVGHRNTGALIGYNNGTVKLSGEIVLDNVSVKTVGGRSGLIIGMAAGSVAITDNSTITLKNGTSYGIYECEQNTGKATIDGTEYTLGLKDGKITSWAYDGTGTIEPKELAYDAAALIYNNAFTFNNIVKQ